MKNVRSWSWLDANTYEGTDRLLRRLRSRTLRWRLNAELRHRRAKRRYDATR